MRRSYRMYPVADIKPNPRNSRTHSKRQIRQLKEGIVEFGFTNPVLVDEHGVLIAGHARAKAAEELGLEEIPAIVLSGLSETQKRALLIADNKLALNSDWDEELLAEELKALSEPKIDFDISLTGFSIPEIELLIEGLAPEEDGNPDEDRLPDKAPVRCTRGDIWQLGAHRLICGDATDANAVAALMNGERAQMVFTDPPYNVRIDGHAGGLGSIKHREFAMAKGEMTRTEFTAFLRSSFSNLVDYSVDGSIHFICMDWRHIREILDAGEDAYGELKNLIVWSKDNGGMGTFYRSRHELIFVFKNGSAAHLNNFELGQHGRYRTNVWQYRGINTTKPGRLEELALHPTVKPVQMIADAIKDVSARRSIILDLFGGSGSTLIAAQKTGRRGYLCEYDPVYCDRILKRWEVYAKDEAERITCGSQPSRLRKRKKHA